MSRSYKKTPYCHYVKKDNIYKKIFNKKIRRTKLLQENDQPGTHKKLNETWYIDDYSGVGPSFETWYKENKYCREYCTRQSKKECYNCYMKFFIRK